MCSTNELAKVFYILNTYVAEKKYNYFQSSSFERDYATNTDSLPEERIYACLENRGLFLYTSTR